MNISGLAALAFHPKPIAAPSRAVAQPISHVTHLHRAHFAQGGMVHEGAIKSPVAGRTDHIPLKVAGGSYVIPADVVSGLGQGNTDAGHQVLDHMLRNLIPSAPPIGGHPVDIMAAGGEYVIPPRMVMQIGAGSVKRGHEVLDRFVLQERKKLTKTLSRLPGPVRR